MPQSPSEKAQAQPGSHTRSTPEKTDPNDSAQARQPQTSVTPVEPEDPKVNGNSDAQKNALDLNVGRHQESGGAGTAGHQSERHLETSAGQHATGSYTEEKSPDRKKA